MSSKNKFSRRDFVVKSTKGLAGIAVSTRIPGADAPHAKEIAGDTAVAAPPGSFAREELARTELSLLAATRDSRMGFQFEQDYVYTPYSLKEKINILKETLNIQIPAARSSSAL